MSRAFVSLCTGTGLLVVSDDVRFELAAVAASDMHLLKYVFP